MSTKKHPPEHDDENVPAEAGEGDCGRELDPGTELPETSRRQPPGGIPIGVPVSAEEYRRLKRSARGEEGDESGEEGEPGTAEENAESD